jgi:serine/threonine protein kinase
LDSSCIANVPLAGAASLPVELVRQEDVANHAIGTTIDKRYFIDALIAQGGMGAVYRATHTALNKKVAIKILWPYFSSNASAEERFHQEAKAASRLTHPGLVLVHDYGLTECGAPYLVMQFAEGESLAAVLEREGRLDVARMLEIFVQICEALSYAHANQVIHRDVKPGNIIIDRCTGTEKIQIVDFGIAKLLSVSEQDPAVTLSGEIIGSPYYMSPEQCMGDEVDHRTDIYSVACVMYETLTGEPPFCGQHTMHTMYKQVNEPVNFALCKELKVPLRLQRIIDKAMAKKPQERFATLDQLKEELVALKETTQSLSLGNLRQRIELKGTRRRSIVFDPLVALISCWIGASLAFSIPSLFSLAGQYMESQRNLGAAASLYSQAIEQRKRFNSSQVEPLRVLLYKEAKLLRKLDRPAEAAKLEDELRRLH